MRTSRGLAIAVGLVVLVTVTAVGLAQRSPVAPAPTPASGATARIVKAAQAFVSTLDAAGRAKAQLPFDSPQKNRWSNLPITMVPRNGVRLGDLTFEFAPPDEQPAD